MQHQLGYADVRLAADRIAGKVRPVGVVPAGGQRSPVWLALEQLQHTGSFKARGARNFLAAHIEAGTLPDAGVTIASGGNAGLACAWAAREAGVPATVFLPETAPAVKVARLRSYGAEVRLRGGEYAEALAACEEFTATTGALPSHAYDHPLIAAGAGTLVDEMLRQVPGLDTVVVSVGGGGLFAGVATAALHHGLRAVAVEPEHCRALNAALEHGRVVDVPVDSVAADALGARRATPMALAAAQRDGTRSVLVPDAEIVRARRALWDEYRLAVELSAAAGYAALAAARDGSPHGYAPDPDEKVAVVLCGANTDPGDLAGEG
ncbi:MULTISPECIES: threonine/serine dehydratase [Streptomyces]|uniref:Threonine/serine dehydratase n=1 Tax=Streptomyces lycii TaxID=2654337 RepID=A0ABQ7FMS5_9ACTN|nr:MULTISPECIES: threonine/serine dehydratase [Streptomyces]KAF4410130.1 threonine/serine dehydratase [Streptomyces lycii]PGH47783.1 threonine dehydratase [Streptomyces sp. Ru87]